MRLTEQQLEFFDAFGFLKFPGLFANDIDEITDAFERVWADHISGHGNPHDPNRRSVLVPFLDQSEYLSALLDDPRIEGIASSLLGDDFNYSASDGSFNVGDTNWHSDSCRNVGYRQVKADPCKFPYLRAKLAFYLDPLTHDSGCLRVIPGSHRVGDSFADSLEEQLREGADTMGVHGRDVPALALETVPGDLLMFDVCIKHASFGGSTRRGMFIVLQERYREEHLPQLRETISEMAGTKAGTYRFEAERAYGDAMIRTATPGRMRHLEQRLTNDGQLREMVRELREWDEAGGTEKG